MKQHPETTPSGYTFQVDHLEYDAHRDGTPLTLVDCLVAVRGCGNATVWAPNGRTASRLPRRHAGSMSARHEARRGAWAR